MNPHRLCWGFAYSFPFAEITAIATLIAIWRSKEAFRMPWTRESVLLLMFVGWMLITTIFSLYPELAWEQWNKVWKIQLFIFMTMLVINTKQQLDWLIWVMAGSLALYGIKGGIFTILHGGVHRVYGPEGTFIGGNNEIGLALIMTIPLLRYVQLQAPSKWRPWLHPLLTAAIWLTGIAAIGTQSRGALVGILPMAAFFWWKSRSKIFTLLAIGAVAWAVTAIMPQEWYDRMRTIENYKQDNSAMGRINAWWMAYNLAQHRPTGGGFETFQVSAFRAYAPDPRNVHDVHSIYFEIMGEQGFIGFGMWMLLAWFTWNTGNRIKRRAKKMKETKWAADLVSMLQVSMIGFASAGAFLGLAYFDLYYTLIAAMVICKVVLEKQLAALTVEKPEPRLAMGRPKGQPAGAFPV
jgi:probable O-glycosylation ligase (exosortase A-associated)